MIDSRIWNMVGFGALGPVDDSGPVQTAQVTVSSGGVTEIQDARPMVSLFGFASNPPAGSQTVMLYQNGDRSKGVSIGVNHQGSRPTGQLPGESMQFNLFGMTVKLAQAGLTIDGANKPLVVKANGAIISIDTAGNMTLTPSAFVNVVGQLQVNGIPVEVP